MVLMTVDHSMDTFSQTIVSQDSAYLWNANGAELRVDGSSLYFLTRWISHICAPTFLLLAGVSLALSEASRKRRGLGGWLFDRHLIARGLLLVLFDFLLFPVWGLHLVQVLTAIGLGLIAMAALRRLPTWFIVALGAAITLGHEGLLTALGMAANADAAPFTPMGHPGWAQYLLVPDVEFFTPGAAGAPWYDSWLTTVGEDGTASWSFFGRSVFSMVMYAYPVLPWLGVMLLGWGCGRGLLRLQERGEGHLEESASRASLLIGAGLLALFVTQRLMDGYGNMWLHRTDDSWLRWLHVSKYPPSLAYLALELGLAFVLLGVMFRVARARADRTADGGPLLVLGQTALVYYMLHLPAMALVGWLLFDSYPGNPQFALVGGWLGALCCVVVLYPVCRAYRALKRRHPGGILSLL